MESLQELFQKVLTRYPELQGRDISIGYTPLGDAYGEYEIDTWEQRARIQIDAGLKYKKTALKIATIASQLSLILKDTASLIQIAE